PGPRLGRARRLLARGQEHSRGYESEACWVPHQSFLVQRGLPRDGASSVPERAWATERGARATVLGRAQGWGMRSVPVHHARARHVLCKARQGGVAAAPRPEGAEPGGTVPPSHVLSIDVEDWFQVENYARAISRDQWPRCELRVGENVRRLLDL